MKKLSQTKKSLQTKRQQRHEVLFQRLEDRAPSADDAKVNSEWEEFRSVVNDLKAMKPFGDLASLHRQQFSNEHNP